MSELLLPMDLPPPILPPTRPGISFSVPLPPPDNMCHRSSAYARYPTAGYKDWLKIAAPLLREALEGRQPDRERWWWVEIGLTLGSRADGQNYLKPLLDLLSGAQVDEEGQLDPASGKRVGKGKIIKPGGLWDDDRRIERCVLVVETIRHPEPFAAVEVWPCEPGPADYREAQKERAREARAAEKARVLALRTRKR